MQNIPLDSDADIKRLVSSIFGRHEVVLSPIQPESKGNFYLLWGKQTNYDHKG